MRPVTVCTLAVALIGGLYGVFAPAAEAEQWSAGVSKRVITPTEPMWMSGYTNRTKPAEGKLTDLWVKALVLDDGEGNRVLLITADLVGIHRDSSRAVRGALSKGLKIPMESIAINVSHTHSGPVLEGVLEPQQDLDTRERENVQRYTKRLEKEMRDVAVDAIANLAPARVSWGVGECGFAVNRRENVEKQVSILRKEGGLKGPVDHSVPVLRVEDGEGKLKAVLFGYACHATVTNLYEWSGDYPGFAQMAVEEAHPGATAMFFAGCGADQNPLPRRTVELAKGYGEQLAASVSDVLGGEMRPIGGKLGSAWREIGLEFGEISSEEELKAKLGSKVAKEVRWAKRLLERMDGATLPTRYPYPVQAWKLGDGPMLVLLGGEVVVDYSLRLKKEMDGEATWVAGYSNDVMNYIPSKRVFDEGGYEGKTGYLTYGRQAPWTENVEELIVLRVLELARQAGR